MEICGCLFLTYNILRGSYKWLSTFAQEEFSHAHEDLWSNLKLVDPSICFHSYKHMSIDNHNRTMNVEHRKKTKKASISHLLSWAATSLLKAF